MSLLIATIAASLIAQQGPSQEPTPFTRTYALKEQVSYSLATKSDIAGTLTATISLNVVKFLPDKVPQVIFKTSKCVDSNRPKNTKQPDEQSCLIGKNNLPASIRIMDTNMVYLFLVAAGPTPDKVVKVGDVFPMNIDIPDGQLKLKGQGTLKSVDAEKRTATVEWVYSQTINNVEAGHMRFTSTYDQTNYSLLKSTGSIDLGDPNDILMTVSISKAVAPKAVK